MSQAEDKLQQMGYTLPSPPAPLANYIPGYQTGNLVFLSGVGPRSTDGTTITGKVGQDLTLEQGILLETDLTMILQTTSDRMEGIRSFLERRAPTYTGE